MYQRISTSCSQEDWEYAKRHGLRWADLIHKGIIMHMKPDITTEQLIEVRNELDAYKKKLDNMKRQKNILGF
jgi:hypothetical protein